MNEATAKQARVSALAWPLVTHMIHVAAKGRTNLIEFRNINLSSCAARF